MKIAVVTDDGKTISQHFGRAPYYMVVTIEAGKIINREQRDKVGHAQFQQADHGSHENEGGRHGYGSTADLRHRRMIEAVSDCEVLLARGMGMGAYENMKTHNIRPIVTDITNIDEAVTAYLNGQIIDHIDKLH